MSSFVQVGNLYVRPDAVQAIGILTRPRRASDPTLFPPNKSIDTTIVYIVFVAIRGKVFQLENTIFSRHKEACDFQKEVTKLISLQASC